MVAQSRRSFFLFPFSFFITGRESFLFLLEKNEKGRMKKEKGASAFRTVFI
jgi:hypothetical protein